MGLVVNTKRAHRVVQRGDLTLILTWVNDERAMVLLPTFRRGAPWFIVMDSVAWRYDDPRYLARMSAKAAEVLGMDGQEVRIATLLHDNLGELVTMPSAPPVRHVREVMGEVRMLEDGKEIGGAEVRAEIAEGQEFE